MTSLGEVLEYHDDPSDPVNVLRPRRNPRNDFHVSETRPLRVLDPSVNSHTCFITYGFTRTVSLYVDKRYSIKERIVGYNNPSYPKRYVRRDETEFRARVSKTFLTPLPHFISDFDVNHCFCKSK